MIKEITAYELYCDECETPFGEFASEGHSDFYRSAGEAVDAATTGDGAWQEESGKVICNACYDKRDCPNCGEHHTSPAAARKIDPTFTPKD